MNMKIKPSASIEVPEIEINSQWETWLKGLNSWQLVGMETMTIWMKSTISAYCAVHSDFTPEHIQKAAYLEEAHQMRGSGEV